MMFAEVSEHFMDMFTMEIGIVGVAEDIIQVNEDANIEEARMSFMNCSKVARELVSPKGITHHSKEPEGVWNAVFHSLPKIFHKEVFKAHPTAWWQLVDNMKVAIHSQFVEPLHEKSLEA